MEQVSTILGRCLALLIRLTDRMWTAGNLTCCGMYIGFKGIICLDAHRKVCLMHSKHLKATQSKLVLIVLVITRCVD